MLCACERSVTVTPRVVGVERRIFGPHTPGQTGQQEATKHQRLRSFNGCVHASARVSPEAGAHSAQRRQPAATSAQERVERIQPIGIVLLLLFRSHPLTVPRRGLRLLHLDLSLSTRLD